MAHGDGSVFKRGNVWWIKFHRDGQPVSLSCKGLTEAQARTKLRAEQRKTDDEFVGPKEKRVTIKELIADLRGEYETQGRHDLSITVESVWRLHLGPFFDGVKAHEFGSDLQKRYRAQRTASGAAIATVNREIQILRRAFKVASEQEPPKIKRVPKFIIAKENNRRLGFVNVPQMEALKAAAATVGGHEWRVLIELAHWLGWRAGELLNLKVGNVHLHDGGQFGCVRLEEHETKNHKPREVPMTQGLRSYLEPMVRGRQPGDRIFSITLRWTWPRITAAAGLPDLLFHDLRRSSARTKRNAGIDVGVIMEMQGWLTDSMFRRYAIVAPDDKANALAQQADYETRVLLAAKSVPVTIDASPDSYKTATDAHES